MNTVVQGHVQSERFTVLPITAHSWPLQCVFSLKINILKCKETKKMK